MHISSLFSSPFVTFFFFFNSLVSFFSFFFFDDGTVEGEHASLSGGICYSNFIADQIIKKECHSVGCWQHLSLQPCVSIRGPRPSGGLFPLLFSFPVFYLDLKWGLLKNSHLPASGAATFRSPLQEGRKRCGVWGFRRGSAALRGGRADRFKVE